MCPRVIKQSNFKKKEFGQPGAPGGVPCWKSPATIPDGRFRLLLQPGACSCCIFSQLSRCGVRKGPEFLQGCLLDGWVLLEPLWPRPGCAANLPGAATADGQAHFGNPWDRDELSITCEPFLDQEGGTARTSGTCCPPEASPVGAGFRIHPQAGKTAFLDNSCFPGWLAAGRGSVLLGSP